MKEGRLRSNKETNGLETQLNTYNRVFTYYYYYFCYIA